MPRLRSTAAVIVSAVMVFGALTVFTPAASAYTPPPGPMVNNPLPKRPAVKRVLLRHVNASINSAPPGSEIRISSWNMRNRFAVKSMTRAHRRGVSVQFLMDAGNSNKKVPNKFFRDLRRNLSKGNYGRTPDQSSWAKRCRSSCRGRTGITHTKFFLFSQAGGARNVVMYGSANLTDLAATHQWNDLYTVTGDPQFYQFMRNIFIESSWDYAQPQPYRVAQFAGLLMTIWPSTGPGAPGNPVLADLNRVTCTGAAPGYGNGRGRTSIRIAITATLGTTGIDIGNRLNQLWSQGCDVKVIYAVMGNNVLGAFRAPGPRGGVPIRQVVQDFNHDGVYDRYLHTKFMAISGNFNGNPATDISMNGSANWTPVALVSDETYAHVPGPGVRRAYHSYVDHWFNNAPKSWSRRGGKRTNTNRMGNGDGPAFGRLVGGVNPYAKVQLN